MIESIPFDPLAISSGCVLLCSLRPETHFRSDRDQTQTKRLSQALKNPLISGLVMWSTEIKDRQMKVKGKRQESHTTGNKSR